MRLTLHTDYALRVLIFVALRGGTLSTISEISDHFGISRGHLMKVVHRLGRAGHLQTVRGKNGGLRLARPPSRLKVGDVVRDMEPEHSVLGCLESSGYCRIERHCVLRGAMRDATDAFFAVLDRYTVADLIRPGRALALDLAIPFPKVPHKAAR